MSDLISRQDAIDAVAFGITYAKVFDVNTGESKEVFEEGNDALKKAVERLKELPSAEPKTGRWIMTREYFTGAYESIDYVKCSFCGEDSLEEGDYCPNCGAKMIEQQKG